jgi:hypothetical protein
MIYSKNIGKSEGSLLWRQETISQFKNFFLPIVPAVCTQLVYLWDLPSMFFFSLLPTVSLGMGTLYPFSIALLSTL